MLPLINGIMRIHTKEIRYLPNGNALLKMNCVSSDKYKTQSGEQRENTCWIECVAFAKQAEIIDKFFNEKDRIFIQGSLKQDSWETQDGQKRSKHVVSIDKFDFIEKNNNQNNQQQTQQQQYQQPTQQTPEIDIDEDLIPFNKG